MIQPATHSNRTYHLSMSNISLQVFLLILFCANTIPHVACSQDLPPATDHATALAPFIDSQTFLVAHVDLDSFDFDESLRWFWQAIGESDEFHEMNDAKLAEYTNQIKRHIKELREAGARHVYAVVSMSGVQSGGPLFLVMPVREGVDQERLATLLAGKPAERAGQRWRRASGDLLQEIVIWKGAVVVGPAETKKKLTALQGVARPELASALRSVAGANLQIALLPTDDHRRVLREMLPPLGTMLDLDDVPRGFRPAVETIQKSLNKLDGDALADGLQWVALGVKFPPNMSVELIVQSNSADAAALLHEVATELRQQALALIKPLSDMLQAAGEHAPQEAMNTLALGDRVLQAFKPRLEEDRLVVSLAEDQKLAATWIELIKLPIVAAQAESSRRARMHNLRRLAIALHMYHDTNKIFPPSASADEKGNKLLSWRVHVLPYLEQQKLYERFHLDEPWDSEHNRKLIPLMPKVFASPNSGLHEKFMANYLAPVGEKMAFGETTGYKFKEFTDGTSNTILLVEVEPLHAVIWTKPEDLSVDLEHPLRGLVSKGNDTFAVAMADGSARIFDGTLKLDTLRALFTRNGGEPIEW